MKTCQYRGFEIKEIFKFSNGKSDWTYTRLSDQEDNGVSHFSTLDHAKQLVDARLEERPEIFDVRISRSTTSPIHGFLEALDYARYWNGNLIADFQNP